MGEQHFLTNLLPYEALLSQLDLDERVVLEFGVGHGELTHLILDQGATVIGYELDPSLTKSLFDPQLVILHQDIFLADFSYLNKLENPAIIANPPYSTLPKILDLIQEHDIGDYILMVPAKYLNIIPHDAVEIIYQGLDFTPPSKGEHFVIRSGF